MKITLSDEQTKVVLSALEAFSRMRIGQFKTALEQVFPQKCWDLGWNKLQELEKPLKNVFFPNHPHNGGPGICSEEAGKEAHIAYEIQKAIEQFQALQKSNGWFGNTVNFDGNLLNPSGLPPPTIEGLTQMQYKDFLIPDEYQDTAEVFFKSNDYKRLWGLVDRAIPNLPRGEKSEIVYIDENNGQWNEFPKYHVRVWKPRKPVGGEF